MCIWSGQVVLSGHCQGFNQYNTYLHIEAASQYRGTDDKDFTAEKMNRTITRSGKKYLHKFIDCIV